MPRKLVANLPACHGGVSCGWTECNACKHPWLLRHACTPLLPRSPMHACSAQHKMSTHRVCLPARRCALQPPVGGAQRQCAAPAAAGPHLAARLLAGGKAVQRASWDRWARCQGQRTCHSDAAPLCLQPAPDRLSPLLRTHARLLPTAVCHRFDAARGAMDVLLAAPLCTVHGERVE